VSSVIPPEWWMEKINAVRDEEGLPRLTRLDPIAMACWNVASEEIPISPFLISGV
jgi:hypothetical protein